MKKKKTLIIIPLIILGLLTGQIYLSRKQSNEFLVSRIIDGDTIELQNNETIRYIGIDAPEAVECFSQEATELNKSLVLNQKIKLVFDENNMDRFGRKLAYVFVKDPKTKEEIFVNEYLLEVGAGKFFLDTVNLKHQEEFVQAAETAHQEKQGLWKTCATDPKEGCLIKGNLDKLDKRYYHLPSFRHYSSVVINLEKGDQWFCTEQEAIKAGFIKARE